MPSFALDHFSLPTKNRPIWRTDVARAYLDGVTIETLQEFYDIPRERVVYILGRQGVALRDESQKPHLVPPKPKRHYFFQLFSDQQVQHIIQKYKRGASAKDIAAEVNTSPSSIRRLLKKHGVKMRTKSEVQRNIVRTKSTLKTVRVRAKTGQRMPVPSHVQVIDWDKAVRLYQEGTTIQELCQRFSCGRPRLRRAIRAHGLEVRSGQEVQQLLNSRSAQRAEEFMRTDPKAFAIKDHYIKGMHLAGLAKEFNVAKSTVRRILAIHGVPQRSFSETRKIVEERSRNSRKHGKHPSK